MKILAVNGSPRNDGATAKALTAAAEVIGGAEVMDLNDLKISHCRGCNACKTSGECAVKDDMTQMYEKIRECDFLMLSSPIYFGEETGLFKNFLDRMYAFVTRVNGERKVNIGKPKKGSILLTCGAPDGQMTYQGVATHLIVVMKSFGITDVSSAILPNASTDNILDTDHFRDYRDSLEFQMM